MEQILQELQKLRTDFNTEQQETRKLIEESLKNDQIEKGKIKEKIEKQDNRINKLESGTRKKNVIVYGMQEENNEHINDLKEKINWLLNNKMELDIKREEIDDFFRLGKKTEEKKNRPIIIKMISNWRKTEIMMNKKKLRGTRIFIENDMSEEEMTEKKNMIAEMRELKSKGHEAYIKGKSLIVNMDKDKKNEDVIIHSGNNENEGLEIMEEQASSSQANNTIYQKPMGTPGKRYLSPENINEIRKMLTTESVKKMKLQARRRSNSDGQKTLDSMLIRKKGSVSEEKNTVTRNIAYVSIVHNPSEKTGEDGKEKTIHITEKIDQ